MLRPSESICDILVWYQHFVLQSISDAGWFIYAFIWKIGQFPRESPSLHACVSLTSCLIHPFLFPHLLLYSISFSPHLSIRSSVPSRRLCLAHSNTLVGWMVSSILISLWIHTMLHNRTVLEVFSSSLSHPHTYLQVCQVLLQDCDSHVLTVLFSNKLQLYSKVLSKMLINPSENESLELKLQDLL